MRSLSALLMIGLALACSLAATAAERDLTSRMSDLPILHIEVPVTGEVWIRVDPNHASEVRSVMSEVARRYRELENPAGDVIVVLWVGGRPLARETYAAPSRETDDESPEAPQETINDTDLELASRAWPG